MRGTRTNQSSQSSDTKDRGANAAQRRVEAATSASVTSAVSAAGVSVETAAPAEILALQRAIGNAAVGKLMDLQRHAHGPGCGHGGQNAEAEAEQAPVQRSSVHSVLATSGKPLNAPLRAEMETRLGTDFSDVRVHDDTAARRSAAEIGARAYTSGSHVVIGAGGGDKHTLAHELTHVIQQRQGAVAGTDNGSGLKVSDPGDRFEKAAEANASRAMAAPLPAAEPAVQRRPAAAESDGVPSVQRAGAQHVMTEEYWKEAAGAGEKSNEAATRDREIRDKAKSREKKWKQGQKRRMDEILGDVGRELLEDLAKSKSNSQLKLYRSMSAEEADGILNYFQEGRHVRTEDWIKSGGEEGRHYRSAIGAMPIGKHLGDYPQADEYRQMKGDSHAVMLEFTLKPGAHKALFSPKYAAMGPGRKTEYIRASHRGSHENAEKGEGTLAGYIGVKAEQKEPYSISLASDRKSGPGPSQLLFQLFVESVRKVGPAA